MAGILAEVRLRSGPWWLQLHYLFFYPHMENLSVPGYSSFSFIGGGIEVVNHSVQKTFKAGYKFFSPFVILEVLETVFPVW